LSVTQKRGGLRRWRGHPDQQESEIASARRQVDAYSNGFHVSIVEECTYDRSELIHEVNLFDLHHNMST
jgi:hypothetical protein